MNFKKLCIYISFIILFFNTIVNAQNNKPDAIYKNIVIEYQLNEDLSTTYSYSHQLNLLTNNAFRRMHGESFIIYDPLYQTLTVNKSETKMANGQIVVSTPNAYNKVLPRFAKDAPAYNRFREMVVTHLGVEIGATINLDYKLESKKGFLPGLMGNEIIGHNSPIENATIRVIVPTSQQIYFELFNSQVQPVIKEKNQNTIYEWNFKNIPAYNRERQQLNMGDYSAHLIFSTFNNFQDALKNVLTQKAFKKIEDKKLKTLVHVLKNEATSNVEFVLNLQEKIAKQVATYHIPPEVVGYKIRTPLSVWKSAGGTVIEKAVLLASLLNSAGFNAQPVLISKNKVFSLKAASLTTLENCAVHVTVDKECFLLPVDRIATQHLKNNFQGKTIIFLNQKEVKTKQVPITKLEENTTKLNSILTVKNDELLTGKISLNLTGSTNSSYSFVKNANKLKNLISQIFSGKDVKNFNIRTLTTNKSSASLQFTSEKPFHKQDAYLFYKLPNNPKGFDSWHISGISDERFTPLEIPFPLKEKNSFTIELPKNMKLITTTKKIEKKNSVGFVLIEVTQNHGVVLVTREIVLKEKLIPTNKYLDFLQLWRIWNDPSLKEICLKVTK